MSDVIFEVEEGLMGSFSMIGNDNKKERGIIMFRKTIAMLLCTVMVMTVCAGCGTGKTEESAESAETVEESGENTETAGTTETPEDVYAGLRDALSGIEAVEEAATIRYGDGVGYQLSVPIYMAYKSGILEDLGVNLEWIPSANGPLRVEALAAGEIDLFGSGIGGIAIGCAQGSAMMLSYINDDAVIQKFYVAGDDPLADKEVNDAGFTGSAEDWKGREVYMQAGSTLQYLLGHALGKIGLTLQDVECVYMDAPNVNAAMFAGKGETWGVWNFQCYDAKLDEQGFVPVIQGYDVGISLATAYGTNETVWADASKRAAIEKILEVHYAIVDWMLASDENMEAAAQVLTEWGEAEGTAVPYEENLAYLKETKYYTLEENYDFFTSEVENDNGTMVKALDLLMGIMDFYIEQGNYQESDRANMIENQSTLFNSEGLDYVNSVR